MDKIVVTGASKGLGLNICEKLLSSNYKVIGVSRTLSNEFKLLQEKYPKELCFIEYDFNNTCGIQKLSRHIIKEFGNIYGLINNAALGYDGILTTMHEKEIHELIMVNIEAPILLTKYISRSMLINRVGRIINIGSIIGSTGFSGLSVYGATKSSIEGFSKSLSRELGKANITVNTLAPGYMETSMTNGISDRKLDSIKRRSPLGNLVTVDDVSNAILYLLSKETKNITGTTITVDAGSTA